MALAPYFDRVYAAAGRHLAVTRESLEAALSGCVVIVECGRVSDNEATVAELVVNLLARLYPRIEIRADSATTQRLVTVAAEINPSVSLETGADGPRIGIGGGLPASLDAIFPSSDGWVARVSRRPSASSGAFNPLAASASAALSVAELFRRVFLGRQFTEDYSVSLLDFSRANGSGLALDHIDVGHVAMVGLGAVANGALWSLSRLRDVKGHLVGIDPERIALSNLQRYSLASLADVDRWKTDVVAGVLVGTDLSHSSYRGTLEAYADEHGGLDAPVVCVSVDNADGRRAAQALLPRLVVNGWTGDAGLGASWHQLSRETACLACLYHPRSAGASQTELVAASFGIPPERAAALWAAQQPLSEADLKSVAERFGLPDDALRSWADKPIGELYTGIVCGAIPLDLKGVGNVEVVPLAHQSALAGILMAAELVKRTSPSLSQMAQLEPLVAWDDVRQPPPSVWARPVAREPGCICGDDVYQNTYASKWGRG